MIINPYAFSTAGATDPYWANVSLLITGIGVDEATNITDSSSYAHTVTVLSGTKYDSANPPPGQATSVQCPFSGGMTIPDHASLDMGSGDFTVETYLNNNATSANFPMIFNKISTTNFSPFQLLLDFNGINLYTRSSNDGSSYGASILSTGNLIPIGGSTFQHIAWGRTGNTFYGWIDGVSTGTPVTMSGALNDTADILTIGSVEGGTFKFNGQFAGIRITKGVNRYTTSFTPPTLPLPTS